MFYDPRTDQHGLPHNPWTGLIVPRPIGWISSLSADGTRNLAPYSFFNTISTFPPFVMFSSTPRKNSQDNVEATGEFVANIATWELRHAMNTSSTPFDSSVDEFEAAGLTPADCRNVKAPRVLESPISVECSLYQVIPLKPRSGAECQSTAIIGEVVGIHIDDSILVDGKVDIRKIKPIARLGYFDYAVIDDYFTMPRPVLQEMAEKI